MNYGPYASQDEAHAQMDKAHELGINFFDTADVYGWKRGEGVTEQIIGAWFEIYREWFDCANSGEHGPR